jgi:hypothetical protein
MLICDGAKVSWTEVSPAIQEGQRWTREPVADRGVALERIDCRVFGQAAECDIWKLGDGGRIYEAVVASPGELLLVIQCQVDHPGTSLPAVCQQFMTLDPRSSRRRAPSHPEPIAPTDAMAPDAGTETRSDGRGADAGQK